MRQPVRPASGDSAWPSRDLTAEGRGDVTHGNGEQTDSKQILRSLYFQIRDSGVYLVKLPHGGKLNWDAGAQAAAVWGEEGCKEFPVLFLCSLGLAQICCSYSKFRRCFPKSEVSWLFFFRFSNAQCNS